MGILYVYQQIELGIRVISPFLTLIIAIMNLLEESITLNPDQKLVMQRTTGSMLVLIAIPATLVAEFARNTIPQIQTHNDSFAVPEGTKFNRTWKQLGKDLIPFRMLNGIVY